MSESKGSSSSQFSSDMSLTINGMSQQWLDLLSQLEQPPAPKEDRPARARSLSQETPALMGEVPSSPPEPVSLPPARPRRQRRQLVQGALCALSCVLLLGAGQRHFRAHQQHPAPATVQPVTQQMTAPAPQLPPAPPPAAPAPEARLAEHDEATEERGDDLRQELRQARTLLLHDQRDEAEQRYQELLKTHRRSPSVRAGLGDCALDAGRIDEALARYGEALELRPDHGGALYGMGRAYRQAGHPEQAVLWFRKYEQLLPHGSKVEKAQRQIAALEAKLGDAERETLEKDLVAPF